MYDVFVFKLIALTLLRCDCECFQIEYWLLILLHHNWKGLKIGLHSFFSWHWVIISKVPKCQNYSKLVEESDAVPPLGSSRDLWNQAEGWLASVQQDWPWKLNVCWVTDQEGNLWQTALKMVFNFTKWESFRYQQQGATLIKPALYCCFKVKHRRIQG